MNLTRSALLAALLLATAVTAGCTADSKTTQPDQPTAKIPTTSPSPSSSPGTTPGTAGQVPTLAAVSYVQKSWGDPKTEVGIVILAPKGWSMVKLSTFEVRFSSVNKLWNLRVNGWAADDPVKTLADRKYQTIQSVKGFQLISRVDSSTKATNSAFSGVVFHHTTLTYSYLEPARGRRLVVERFVALNEQPHTLFQLSAGGRPQDVKALTAITDKATADFIRLP